MPDRPTRVVLVGFMGSGKTSVGRVLARRLGYLFEDMDRRIEERTGRTIADIFREDGEEAFREMECEEARALVSLPRRVVAAGGGAFTRPGHAGAPPGGGAHRLATVRPRADSRAGPGRRLPPPGREP